MRVFDTLPDAGLIGEIVFVVPLRQLFFYTGQEWKVIDYPPRYAISTIMANLSVIDPTYGA